MIRVREYEPADRDAVLRLLCEELTPERAAAKAASFDWQFGENPRSGDASPFVLAVAGDDIVGVQGGMPARILYKGARLTAAWPCDTYITKRFRGRGLGTELLRSISERADVVLAYGIADGSDHILEGLGWRLSRDVGGYSLRLRADGILGGMKVLHGTVRRLRRPAPPPGLEVTVDADGDFGAEVDRFWSRCAPGYISVVERDAAYLNWKYRRHPFIAYRCYAGRRRGELCGLLIARAHPELSVIADYCGPRGDLELVTALIDAAVDDLRRGGAKAVHCQTTDTGVVEALRANGFHPTAGAYRLRGRCNFARDDDPCAGFFVITGDSDNDFSDALPGAETRGPREGA